jgi:hypothetical protein
MDAAAPRAQALGAALSLSGNSASHHVAEVLSLSFERCVARVDNAALAALCARAGAALRTLSLDGFACARVTAPGMVLALRDGGCTGLRRLSTPLGLLELDSESLTAEQAQQLAAACPKLTHTACAVRCSALDAAAVVAALPGPLLLDCSSYSENEGLTHLAECLRDDLSCSFLQF